MKATLIDLFTSKKFLAALSAIAIYLAGRFGCALDPAALDRIFAALLVYVGAQGVADVGKSAAAINAVAATAGTSSEGNAAMKRASTVTALALFVALGGAALTACGGTQTITDTPQRIVDCAKQDVGQVASLAAELARSVTAYLVAGTPVDWDAIEAQAEAAGLTIGGCALGPLVAARGPSSSSTAPARATATLPANDAARAWAAFARLKGKSGVATYQTSAGPL